MAAALIVLCSAVACGGLDRGDLADAYAAEHPDLDPVTAGCIVDDLIAVYGVDGLEAELADGADPDYQLAHFRARFGCGVHADVVAALRPQLEARGLDPAAAGCVAQSLSDAMEIEDLDVVLTGPMTDDFYAKYFDALEDCDAL